MFEYQSIHIHYKFIDNNSDKSLIFLHGWGQNIEMMEPIAQAFIHDANLLLVDLPGFGKSEEPKEIWSLEDYANMLHTLVKKLKLKNNILIGHSFGGKIALCYATAYETKKLVLLSSPYKVAIPKPSLKVKILKQLAKIPFLKKVALKMKKKMGSQDYRNASPKMRSILVKHVNTDLTEICQKITCPTIIIWGTNDKTVSIENAYELEKLIPDSAVIEYAGGTHFAYLENKNKTISIIKAFME